MKRVQLCGDATTNKYGDYLVCIGFYGHAGFHSDGDEHWNEHGEDPND